MGTNEQSAPKVDVLAVMDGARASMGMRLPGELDARRAEMAVARAAVDELIEAADEALVLLEQLDPQHGITTHLRATLANIGPQS